MAASVLMQQDVGDQVLVDDVATYTAAGTWYLALFKTGSGLSAGSAAQEVQTSATAGYNRQACTVEYTGSGSTHIWSNAAQETFTASGAAWDDVGFYALCESGTPGTNDVKIYGTLDATITNITDGSSVVFDAGDLDFTVS